MNARSYRVLVGYRPSRVEGGCTFYEEEWVNCTQEQAARYAAGDPSWRQSKEPQSTLLERFRGWLRLGWQLGR
jgi:hypothetical protein